TFLQRGYDQLIHDVSIDKKHVVFCVDRAGITGEDGETHHGTFDIPQLMSIPHMEILSPSSYDELDEALKLAAYHFNGPVAVRYPRGVQRAYKENNFTLAPSLIREGEDVTIVTYGIMVNEALKASDILREKSINTDVVKLNHLTGGFMPDIIKSVKKTKRLIVLEECFASGCIGNKILAALYKEKTDLKFVELINIGDDYVKHGKAEQLYQKISIDGESVARIAENGVRNG
ncbi:MAG: 1-deoxy-D-xylulose-5-phosphate synthase, partial [Clostridia bacterium]|nr:1-deoxy-D-xylulose-5-phosphate synthase [Clostridia bacterium]